MRRSSNLHVFACLVLFFLSVPPGYGEEKWNEWKATDTVLRKGNMGIRTQISGGQRLLDDLCTLNTLGLNIIVFADASSSHNLRTWLLTKGFSYIYGSPTFVPIPGSVWQGNSDEPAVMAVGSQGFCCLSEDPPPGPLYPFIQNNIYHNIMVADYLYRVSVGSVPVTLDTYLNLDFNLIANKWAALPPPEDPYRLSAKKVAIMNGVLSSGDEANSYAFIYRSKGVKTLSTFTSWFRGKNGGGGTNSYCQFSMPWPVTADTEFFRKKYDECSSLREILSFCDVTSPDLSGLLSLDETHYRAVLGAGWKVSPAFCFHSYDISRNCNAAYEGLWLDDSLMSAFPQVPQPPGSEEPVKVALERLMENLRTSRRNYVSQFIVSDQESSLKLEMNDLYGNRIAAMGDSIDPPSGAKLKLTVDYQNLTPKSNLFMEKASLVVIYQYRSGQTHAREVSFTGLHSPVRNYIFTRHSGKEVKNRTFSRIFDNFDNIQGIYGKITYREPSDSSLESIKDYYEVKKRASIQKEYTAFTTPIWVRRN